MPDIKALKPLVRRVRRDAWVFRKPMEDGGWSKPSLSKKTLSSKHLHRHLNGDWMVGCYPMQPDSNKTMVAMLDIDDHDKELEFKDLRKASIEILEACELFGLRGHEFVSSSGHGIHIFFLWPEPQDAGSVRELLSKVLEGAGYIAKNGGGGLVARQIEVFPKQSYVPEDAYGNQFWLPYGGKSECLGNDGEWKASDAVPVIEEAQVESRELVLRNTGDYVGREGELADLLSYIGFDEGEDYSYARWLQVGMSVHHATSGIQKGLQLWMDWSLKGSKSKDMSQEDYEAKWESFGNNPKRNEITSGTLKILAKKNGWKPDVASEFDIIDDDNPVPNFERMESGKIRPSISNLMKALDDPRCCGYNIHYDTFLGEIILEDYSTGDVFELSDEHYQYMRRRLDEGPTGFSSVNDSDLRKSVYAYAKNHSRDYAIEWLEGLKWDGVPRIDTFLNRYFQAENTEYVSAVSKYMWTALAGRVLVPGIKADMIPVFVSDQGKKKSWGIASLVPERLSGEVDLRSRDTDTIRKMKGKVVIEINELSGLGSREEESIRAFVTRQVEEWVPKYFEKTSKFKRRCVFFGTSNPKHFLSDMTGNRRWLPVENGEIDRDAIIEDRDLIWAEARETFKEFGVLFEDAERLAKEEHKKFMAPDPWAIKVQDFIRSYHSQLPKPDGSEVGIFISVADLYQNVLNVGSRYGGGFGKKLGTVMSFLGFESHVNIDRDSGMPISGWALFKDFDGE